MNNRVKIFKAGHPEAVVGEAECAVDMVVLFHGKSGGSGDENGDLANTDYLVVTAVADNIVTAVSHTSGLTVKEYCEFTKVADNDATLNIGTDWPDAATHFPY